MVCIERKVLYVMLKIGLNDEGEKNTRRGVELCLLFLSFNTLKSIPKHTVIESELARDMQLI